MKLKDLLEVIKKYDIQEDANLDILFECSEARPDGFQYHVKVLDIAYLSNGSHGNVHGEPCIVFCHEEDYENHYSYKKVKRP